MSCSKSTTGDEISDSRHVRDDSVTPVTPCHSIPASGITPNAFTAKAHVASGPSALVHFNVMSGSARQIAIPSKRKPIPIIFCPISHFPPAHGLCAHHYFSCCFCVFQILSPNRFSFGVFPHSGLDIVQYNIFRIYGRESCRKESSAKEPIFFFSPDLHNQSLVSGNIGIDEVPFAIRNH